MDDETLDRIGDAVWSAMASHESLQRDSVCTCGVVNNMDGDVLFSHRVSMVIEAVEGALGV